MQPIHKKIRNVILALATIVLLIFTVKALVDYSTKRTERKEKEKQEQEIQNFIKNRLETRNQDNEADPFGDDNIVRVLLVGLDARIGQTSAHCDAIQLFEINKETESITITAVPRGTYSPLPPGKGVTSSDYYVSNSCGLGGIDYGIKQIENILGKKADYFVFVGFSQTLGVLQTLKLPTVETLQWLRQRHAYAIGEPQRAHNHSTFLKKLIIDHAPQKDSSIDTPLQYLLYKIIKTDLSFSQVQQIISAIIPMDITNNPDKITLQMKPFYSVQDIQYDPNTLEEYRHRVIDPIAPQLSKLDFSQMTTEQIQEQIVTDIKQNTDNNEFMLWAWENKLWYQIKDETTREEIHYTLLTWKLSQIPDADKQEIVADYILEMEYLELSEWSKKGKELLSKLLS